MTLIPTISSIAASLASLRSTCTSCLPSCALEGHRQDLRQIPAPTLAFASIALTTPPSPPPPSRLLPSLPSPSPSPPPTLQVIAKISVGEAPDLIKLAKTEHLTPIEERIKDLHESMNAGQHAQTPPYAVSGFGAGASSWRAWRSWAARHSQAERPAHWAPNRCLGCSSSPPPYSPIPLPLTPQAVRDMQDQMREQDEVRK